MLNEINPRIHKSYFHVPLQTAVPSFSRSVEERRRNAQRKQKKKKKKKKENRVEIDRAGKESFSPRWKLQRVFFERSALVVLDREEAKATLSRERVERAIDGARRLNGRVIEWMEKRDCFRVVRTRWKGC